MKSRQQIRREARERSQEVVTHQFGGDSRKKRRALTRAVAKRAIESEGGVLEVQRRGELQRLADEAKVQR